ncbi:MAG: RNA polymerase subunit sigma-24, partial [Bacteroidetes bacterium]|nr:RNA polymerase subunit sigma-24 [Bacteroidota bacterium]MBU1761673.1 RNA polymerase subunit sigma-24 [Bacteroidota bacterium]
MSYQVKTDQELVHLYIKGKELALSELIIRHKSRIYTSIYLLVKDEYLAEDIFQDTFIKVIKTLKAGKYNEEGKFLPWVLRIGHNLVIDHFRREKRNPTITNSDGFDI